MKKSREISVNNFYIWGKGGWRWKGHKGNKWQWKSTIKINYFKKLTSPVSSYFFKVPTRQFKIIYVAQISFDL